MVSKATSTKADMRLSSSSEEDIDAILTRIESNQRHREQQPSAWVIDGWDSEDEALWLASKHWEMMKALGVKPTGKKPHMKRKRPRYQPFVSRSATAPSVRDPNAQPQTYSTQPVQRRVPLQSQSAKRAAQPFPMTLDGSDTENSSPPSTLPPIPDAQIVVNPDANWKPRSLEAAIEEGKQRKLEELGQEGWDSEDELLCLRREQWRMMRALGIETQETEPVSRWRPGGRFALAETGPAESPKQVRAPAPFPVNLADSDDEFPRTLEGIPPMPDARIIVDESAGWEKRTLESAIEAGIIRRGRRTKAAMDGIGKTKLSACVVNNGG